MTTRQVMRFIWLPVSAIGSLDDSLQCLAMLLVALGVFVLLA